MSKNSCMKCGAKKHTKVGKPVSRGTDSVQRVRCDKCGQIRFNVITPRKKKESNNGPDSNSNPTDN